MITEDMVRSALKNVYDPEIGVDVVNLGLIYKIDIYEQGKKVDVDMTLTTPACPAGPQILEQARREIGALRDVYSDLQEVNINLVWTPFWNPSMMSEDAREELGFFSARFVINPMAARPDADRRYALPNNQLTMDYRTGATDRRVLVMAAELRTTLEHDFRLRLPDTPKLEHTLQQIIERTD